MQHATDPQEFSYIVNLSGVSPEELAVKIEDGRMSVYGEHVERFKDANGATNLSLRGFSNEICLPSGVGTDALTFTICDNQILKIQTKKPCASADRADKNPNASTDIPCKKVGDTLQSPICTYPPPPACHRHPSPKEPPKKTCHHASEQKVGQAVAENTAPSSRCAVTATSKEQEAGQSRQLAPSQ